MFKKLTNADHRKRGIATVILSATILVILLFLSLISVPGEGIHLWLDWNVNLFCASDDGFQTCYEYSINFHSKYLFILTFLLGALGVSDYFGLFSHGSKPPEKDDSVS